MRSIDSGMYDDARHEFQAVAAARRVASTGGLRPWRAFLPAPAPALLAGGPVAVAQTDAIVLYAHSGFAGRRLGLVSAAPRLGELDSHDLASSVEVLRGRWQLCTDADYRGRCITLTPGRHNLEKILNDHVSSMRPL